MPEVEPMWTLHIPVLSTIHVPGEAGLGYLIENFYNAVSGDKMAVFIRFVKFEEANSEEPAWVKTLREWANKHEECQWIRLDIDGDEIDDLPAYEDAWK